MMEETFQPNKIMYENPGVRENSLFEDLREIQYGWNLEERRNMKLCFGKELDEISTWRPIVGFYPNV